MATHQRTDEMRYMLLRHERVLPSHEETEAAAKSRLSSSPHTHICHAMIERIH